MAFFQSDFKYYFSPNPLTSEKTFPKYSDTFNPIIINVYNIEDIENNSKQIYFRHHKLRRHYIKGGDFGDHCLLIESTIPPTKAAQLAMR